MTSAIGFPLLAIFTFVGLAFMAPAQAQQSSMSFFVSSDSASNAFGSFQIERVESLSEPLVNRSEPFTRS